MEIGNIESVRKTLKGKTGLDPAIEEKLIENVASMEAGTDAIPPLSKGDRIGIVFCIAVSILLLVYCFAA